jgi:hypothetical protein
MTAIIDPDNRLTFTHHAVDRYVQFYMLDSTTPPDERDVLALLQSHAPDAYKLTHRTKHGQTQWRIDALGCDLVSKHEHGTNVVVTILPPQPLRGLTPDQAERVAESARAAAERAAALQAEQAQLVELQREASKPAAPKEERQQTGARDQRIKELKQERLIAEAERDIMLSLLRTARQQLAISGNAAKLKAALRIALQHLRKREADDVLAAVAAVEPGFVSDAFIYGGGS